MTTGLPLGVLSQRTLLLRKVPYDRVMLCNLSMSPSGVLRLQKVDASLVTTMMHIIVMAAARSCPEHSLRTVLIGPIVNNMSDVRFMYMAMRVGLIRVLLKVVSMRDVANLKVGVTMNASVTEIGIAYVVVIRIGWKIDRVNLF